MAVAHEDGTLRVKRPTDRGEHRALHGLTRSLVANMVEGVTDGFEKRLEIQGVGYRAQLRGHVARARARLLAPDQGRAAGGHPVRGAAPTQVVVRGHRQAGRSAQVAARDPPCCAPPEPYKGKGIRYQGEHVRRKVGKRA